MRPGGRSGRVREAVLRACLDMLAQGKVELPVAEVAERSGVNRATVYRWWPTATDLLADALSFHEAQRGDAPDTGSWVEDVRAFVTQFTSIAADPIERGFQATMISGRYPELNEELMAWSASFEPGWFAMVERAIDRGEVRPDVDPAMVVRLMTATAMSIALFKQREMQPEEIESVVCLVCNGTML
ncbi:TetR/AcrR family transcriptional regulator [Tomitella gaofuii]|uniref:TetR/AcrR family transcriptional regulator n=1 Tax=Tomitella gaofuii TaxID=2760083 RepID=UPI0015F8A752|nr:TetR/AcrR family transcriptional regulator C-terminal ligand-binding domain-containing protein [Tomitella gaofuii]